MKAPLWLTFTLVPSTQCSRPSFRRLTGKLQRNLECFRCSTVTMTFPLDSVGLIFGHRQGSGLYRPARSPDPPTRVLRILNLVPRPYGSPGPCFPGVPQLRRAEVKAAALPPERLPPTSNASQMPPPMSKASCPLLRSGSMPHAFRVQYPLDSDPAQNNTPFLLGYAGISTTAT